MYQGLVGGVAFSLQGCKTRPLGFGGGHLNAQGENLECPPRGSVDGDSSRLMNHASIVLLEGGGEIM
jgi:hypothetical protein